MPRLFYYRHFIGDYDTLTKELSLLEHGAYRRLMDGYYANRGPLPNVEDKLFRIAGAFTADEQAAVRRVLEFFDVVDGWLVHSRCDEEIARVLKESETQAGKARKRWEADSASSNAAAPAVADATGQAAVVAAAGAGVMPVKIQDSKKLTPPKPPRSTVALPDWLPQPAWTDFLAMRQRIRKPATDRAKELLLSKLDALRLGGHDPQRVLEQSIENSWQTVYPLRDKTGGRRSDTEARNNETADAWADN